MRIMVYVMTHLDDPCEKKRQWGVSDCMGKKRDCAYDAVIGIGGVGAEAKKNDISGKLVWVARHPKKEYAEKSRGPLVSFEQGDFVYYGRNGILLGNESNIVTRLRRAKHLVINLSPAEQREAEEIVNSSLSGSVTRIEGAKRKVSKVCSSPPCRTQVRKASCAS